MNESRPLTDAESIVTGWLHGSLMRERAEQTFAAIREATPVTDAGGYTRQVEVVMESGARLLVTVEEQTT